jgi:hypothetical protein
MKHPNHICRFNDGKQSCECYDKGFEAGRKETAKEIKKALREFTILKQREKIGLLRQFLNEERITDPKKMVSSEELLYWLNLKK